jgi:putative pyruvate formate lyase activating enzyme
MARQVGTLELDGQGIAVKGLLIRHLVLPAGGAGSESILRFIAERVSPETHISLMRQYFPAHKAFQASPLDRKITDVEYDAARRHLEQLGLEHGWIQE